MRLPSSKKCSCKLFAGDKLHILAGPFEEHFGAVAAIETGLHAFVAEFVALSSWYYP